MRVLGAADETEMVACFLRSELSSERFGAGLHQGLASIGHSEALLTRPDFSDQHANEARRALLGLTRGYGEDRELFEHFPAHVCWVRAVLTPDELRRVRYVEYSYWNELSGGSRLPVDGVRQINADVQVFGVPNQRFLDAASAIQRGQRFEPLILVGERQDALVCLEGNLRLTGYALAGFPVEVECLIGTAGAMGRWAQ